jgi:hypothetical protein
VLVLWQQAVVHDDASSSLFCFSMFLLLFVSVLSLICFYFSLLGFSSVLLSLSSLSLFSPVSFPFFVMFLSFLSSVFFSFS